MLRTNCWAAAGRGGGGERFRLTRAETPQTDVRPLSLLSVQTVEQLARELGQAVDARRFRANLLLDLPGGGFAEDQLVGRMARVGETAVVAVRERDPRCRFVTYDPDAPQGVEPMFGLMTLLDRRHEGRAGVYASVVMPGMVAVGDAIRVL